MTTLLSVPRVRAFVISEADGFLSRENALVTQTGAALQSGTILTKSGAGYVPYAGGTDAADGVLYSHMPAATGDFKAVVIVREAELNRFELLGLDDNAVTKLAAHMLIVRGDTNVRSIVTPTLV